MMSVMNSLLEFMNKQQSGPSGSAGPSQSPPAGQPQGASSETLKMLQEQNKELQQRFENMRQQQETLQAQQRAKRERVRSLLQALADEDDEEDVQIVEPAGEEEEEEWPDLSFAPAAKKAKGEPEGKPAAAGDAANLPELDLRTCNRCGQVSYTRKNQCVNTACETWPAFSSVFCKF